MPVFTGLNQFASKLEDQNIRFGIIGGLAVFAYGGERTTFDVDFLIHGKDKEAVKSIASKLNFKVSHENDEVLQLSGASQIDIIFANRSASQGMLTRLRKLPPFPYPVVAPEDLIGLKIQAFAGDRSREFTDKGDIITLIRNIHQLDFEKIKEYADIFNVWNEIEDLRKRA
jgi:predicted nucleotidyltransferase